MTRTATRSGGWRAALAATLLATGIAGAPPAEAASRTVAGSVYVWGEGSFARSCTTDFRSGQCTTDVFDSPYCRASADVEAITGTPVAPDSCLTSVSATVWYVRKPGGQYCPVSGVVTVDFRLPSHDIAVTGVATFEPASRAASGVLAGADGSIATVLFGGPDAWCERDDVFGRTGTGRFDLSLVLGAPGPFVTATCAGPASLSIGEHVPLPLGSSRPWYSHDVPFTVRVVCVAGTQSFVEFSGSFRGYSCHAPATTEVPPGEFLTNGEGTVGGQRFIVEVLRGATYVRPYLDVAPDRPVLGSGFFDLSGCVVGPAQSFAGSLSLSWSSDDLGRR